MATVLPLARCQALRGDPRGSRHERRRGRDTPDDRQHHREGAPTQRRRKRGSQINALGRSRGGFSTKIHVVGDADGLPLALHLTPGQTADIAAAEDALELVEIRPKALLADKGYDSDDLRNTLLMHGTRPIIPWKANRRSPGQLDRPSYRHRNRIERVIGFLKHFRRLATRYDKTAASFLSFVQLAAIHRWTRFVHTA